MVDSQIHCVIDNGSGYMKAGFSGEEAPRFIFPSIVGRTKVEGVYVGNEKKESIIGDEAEEKFGILNISYPIQEGVVADWAEAEKLWHHTFYSVLKVPPEEYNVLMTEASFNSRKNREKTIELLFENFNSPGAFLSSQSVLSAYAVGKSTGMSIDVGEGSTNFSPIYEGYLCREAITHIPIAGKQIHELLIKLLIKNGQVLESKMEKEAIKKAKVKHCYIAQNYDIEENLAIEETEFELPDKKIIKIGQEKYQAPEILFNPKLFEYEFNSFQEQFMITMKKVDMDLREIMFANILFNGGTTLFRGFKERVEQEIEKNSPDFKCKKKIHCYPEAQYTAWIGGSILSSLANFGELWITKSEYKEFGAPIVHRKCT